MTQRNTLIGFNIVASVEWDASASYLEELRQGFENASAYLYDASDGQMYLERVTLYDNGQNWADADYQVYASNQQWPHTNNIGGLQSSGDLYVFLGRYFDGSSSNQGRWTQPSGYRTQVHEFGHYGLGLYDSYFYYWGPFKLDGECTSAAVRTNGTPDINATMMFWPYNATELSMQGVNGLWSTQCQQTRQWQVNGESDWETLVRNYRDVHFPPRWEIRTPAGRGGVVAGPRSIPVAGWMNATIGANANTGTCSVEPVYRARYWGMVPVPWVSVWLVKANRSIYQGMTDLQGEITVLGAANGDRLIAVQSVPDLLISSTQVSCLTGLAMGSSTEIVLQPAPFVLDIAVVPTGSAGQAQVSIHASTALSGTPQVRIFQSGSTAPTIVPVAYDSGTQAYTGTFGLDPARPQAGDVEVIAEDTTGHDLQLFSAFSLSQVPASQDVTIYSADGQVELYLPAGSLSADGRLSIAPEATVGALPEGLVMVSGPYTIQAGSGITLTEAVALTLRYLDTGGTLSQANLSTVQVYRRGVAGQWVPLSSNVLEDHNAVSAAIDSLGTYAALAERQYLLYIPIAMRNH